MVAAKWKLPEALIASIRQHHTLGDVTADDHLVLAIHFANAAVNHIHQDQAYANVPALPDVVGQWAGMSIPAAIESLHDLESEINKAKAFIETSH